MVGGLDSDEFVIAERLGMTVAELRATMGADEYHQWRAFHVYRSAMQEKAQKAQRTTKRATRPHR